VDDLPLDADAIGFVEAVLEQGPQAYGLPMMTRTLRDLPALPLRERNLRVSVGTLHRVVHALGSRYRRPRHDLRHRQDAQAVAAAKRVPEWLPKKPTGVRTTYCCRTPLVSIDESEIHTHPYLAPIWRQKGQPMRIPAAGADQNCAIFGALDYASGHLLHTLSARKRRSHLHDLPRAPPPRHSLR
jgi:hypothetical protein